jgi:homocysteine S-methyltransferase
VHSAYFAAGAEVATTASYQCSLEGYARIGGDGAQMLRRSVRLARAARDEHGSGWVAASVGPYGAVLADGSEYRGDYGMSVRALRAFHRPRLEILAAAEPDVLAVETIPSLVEVDAVISELDRLGVPAWLSVTPSGGRLRTGEHVREAFAMVAGCASVIAVGVNCCPPDEVSSTLAGALDAAGKPGVAYPNSGERWDAEGRRWQGVGRLDVHQVRSWLAAGARLVGGCCRVGPAAVSAMADTLHSA